MGIQGITDSQARAMLWSPITPLTDIPFADMLEVEFVIPATMENDCNMMAVALHPFASVVVTLYVPEAFATIDCVVAPVDQR